MKLELTRRYRLLIILLASVSCAYDAKKELEKDKIRFNTNNPKYLKLYIQTNIDAVINELPYRNYNKILNYINSLYINTKYAKIPDRNLKNQILLKIKEIKKMVEKSTYNRALILKIEQLRKLSNKL